MPDFIHKIRVPSVDSFIHSILTVVDPLFYLKKIKHHLQITTFIDYKQDDFYHLYTIVISDFILYYHELTIMSSTPCPPLDVTLSMDGKTTLVTHYQRMICLRWGKCNHFNHHTETLFLITWGKCHFTRSCRFTRLIILCSCMAGANNCWLIQSLILFCWLLLLHIF